MNVVALIPLEKCAHFINIDLEKAECQLKCSGNFAFNACVAIEY